MNTAVTVSPQQGAMLEQVLIGGNLAALKPEERVLYYKQVCESVGLNPITKPFEYITLNGKLTLYALRSCTEQLRQLHGVSIVIAAREVVEDCYVVTARATDAKGRNDESIGAVPIGGLKGEARSNAMMKAETKAKRRVTLSICGLGLLDETEVGSIPGANYPGPVTPTAGAMAALPIKEQNIVMETAAEVKAYLANDQAADAYAVWQNSRFDADREVAFWSQLDSKQRGILSRMKDAEDSQNSGVITEAKRKRLEALIKEKKLDREAVKKYCKEEFGAEHFTELTNEAYSKLDIEISHGNPAFTPSGIVAAPPTSSPAGEPPASETTAGAAAPYNPSTKAEAYKDGYNDAKKEIGAYISDEQARNLLAYCEQTGVNIARVLLKAKVQEIEKIPANAYDRCIAFIDAAAKK